MSTALGSPLSLRSLVYRLWLLTATLRSLRDTLSAVWGYLLFGARLTHQVTHLVLCWTIVNWLSTPAAPLVGMSQDGVKEQVFSPNNKEESTQNNFEQTYNSYPDL